MFVYYVLKFAKTNATSCGSFKFVVSKIIKSQNPGGFAYTHSLTSRNSDKISVTI